MATRARKEPIQRPQAAAAAGYADGLEHLWHGFGRIDMLVRAQTLRWRLTVAAGKPEQLWGMIQVSDAEIDTYLESPAAPPARLSTELAAQLEPLWQAAAEQAEAIAARAAATPSTVELRLRRLAEVFGLSPLQQDVLLLALLPEVDGRYRRLYGYLMDDASRQNPTVELILQILQPLLPGPAAGHAALAEQGPLIARRLVRLVDRPAPEAPLATLGLAVDRRIAGYLLGADEVDGRLDGVLRLHEGAPALADLMLDEPLPEQLAKLAAWWRGGPTEPIVLLHGATGSGRLAAAAAVSAAAGRPLLVVEAEAALAAPCGWPTAVALAYREALLRGAALAWTGIEALLEPEPPSALPPRAWHHLIAAAEREPVATWLVSAQAWDPAGRFSGRSFLRYDFAAPGFALRRRLWQARLPPAADFAAGAPAHEALATLLANSFQLNDGGIAGAVAAARGLAARRDPAAPRLNSEDLLEGCRRQSGRRLMSLAQRIEPKSALCFDDLVLPPDSRRQVEELRARIRLRNEVYAGLGFERRLVLGRGLIALFAGASGTGKTMTALLLAQEQGVDLYRIDLSAVVSKYVGETEKNLARVFTEAEDANAVLFFDEADALFGKRGEVDRAQDRWANMEINFLLQRVEDYSGVVILASNLRQNIDQAFLRRIHVIVEFPLPGATARARIWRGLFPAGLQAPPETVIMDLAERFALSGGSIRNVVVDAAFRALDAAGGGAPVVTSAHLAVALAREYQKLGQPLTRSAFGSELYAMAEADGADRVTERV